ncbi:MAG: hypothetical protein LBL44_04250 [Treponema sp.]|jgi:hypothetical protein|nr:hypothetical protein [Treponema sp.]
MKEKTGGTIFFSAFLFVFTLFSCQNPMVNYLLRESVPEIQAPLAVWNGRWFYTLREAVDAADDGTASSPSVISIMRNIGDYLSMGWCNGIAIGPGKHVLLVPGTPGSSVSISRWPGNAETLFTVAAGATLALDGVSLRGGSMPGHAVYVTNGGNFLLKGGASVAVDNDVYLESGAYITVEGTLGGGPIAPIARLTPPSYGTTVQVLDDTVLGADIAANHARFDVTPEDMTVSGWYSPRHWRVDSAGYLVPVAAKRVVSSAGEGPPVGTAVYYPALQSAIAAATYGSYYAPETVTLLANVDLPLAEEIDVDMRSVSLTVEAGSKYVIKRDGPPGGNSPWSVFDIGSSGVLELGAPPGSALIVDGGAVWSGGTPAAAGTVSNTGVTSDSALVHVGSTPGLFRLKSGAVLQNNDRITAGNGGGVECAGGFEMSGGSVTFNRTAGSGGGIYFYTNALAERTISGESSISGNSAGLSGGGLMFGAYGVKLTMHGGYISGNRARGLPGVESPGCNGYGGGVFIPSVSSYFTQNAFDMRGGEISGNYSDNGEGNGIVVDKMWSSGPEFSMGGGAYIGGGNDIYLSHNNVGVIDRALITISSNLTRHSPAAPALIRLDSVPPVVDVQVLDGLVSSNYMKFTGVGPRYVDSSGFLR